MAPPVRDLWNAIAGGTRIKHSENGASRRLRNGGSHGGQKTKRANGNRRRSQGAKAPKKSVEHYLALAREAEAAGDVVGSQNYYQYAEHYFRKSQEEDR